MNRLSSCQTFQLVDKDLKIAENLKQLVNKIDRYLVNPVTFDHLLRSMSSYKYPLSKLILKATNEGSVKPILLRDPVDAKDTPIFFPSQIPAFVKVDGNKAVSFSNISPKAAYNRNKMGGIEGLKVKEIDLYTFLHMGYVELQCRKFGEKIDKNTPIAKNTAIAYSRLFTRCIDRTYPINANQESQSLSIFLSSVFALVTFFGYEIDDAVSFIFSSKIVAKDEVEPICRVLREGKLKFKNIDEFITLYNYELDEYIRAGSLNLRSVVNLWQKMYGSNAWFAIEHSGTFINMITSPNIDYYNDKFITSMVKSQADAIATSLASIFSS